MLSLKKRGGVGDKQKEPGGRKPNANHHCEEENDAAFGPIHSSPQYYDNH
jgi:hypothetical protein